MEADQRFAGRVSAQVGALGRLDDRPAGQLAGVADEHRGLKLDDPPGRVVATDERRRDDGVLARGDSVEVDHRHAQPGRRPQRPVVRLGGGDRPPARSLSGAVVVDEVVGRLVQPIVVWRAPG